MAVARDSIAHGSVNGGGSFTMTISTAGTNRLVLVAVHNSNSGVTSTVPTATGLTFVQVGTTQTMSSNGTFQVYRAFASSQLTSTVITVTASPSGQFPQMTGQVVTYSGTDTSGTNGSGAIDVNGDGSTGGTDGTSISITTVTNNALCIAFAGESNSQTMVAGASQTLVEQDNNVGGFSAVGLIQQNTATSPAGSVTMSYTLSGNFVPCAINAIGIKPAAASSTQYYSTLATLGVG